MDKNIIKSICLEEGKRIPLEFRKNKNVAIDFLEYIKDSKIEVKNSHIYILANWVGFNLYKYKNNDYFTQIRDIVFEGNKQTVGIYIDGNEFHIINGIIFKNNLK